VPNRSATRQYYPTAGRSPIGGGYFATRVTSDASGGQNVRNGA
jgi:hypothetical protein